MFNITDNEKLRDAYALLMFMQKDVPASSKKKANVKNLAATVKREIRSYNNRPASNVRIISGDYNGHLDLVRLPDELDRMHEEAGPEWLCCQLGQGEAHRQGWVRLFCGVLEAGR